MNLKKPAIPDMNRKPLLRPSGKACASDMTPTRFVLPMPNGSPTPPVRAKSYRAGKDRDAPVVDPYGTPQQASKARDHRMPRD